MSVRLTLFILAMGLCAVAQGMPSSPGFEQGPAVAIISFDPSDSNGLGWFASNTDGERVQSTGGKPAAVGSYYASLLQNAGAYNGAPLGVGSFGSTGFDRIYATFPVSSSTTYQISFQHAGDDRFGYFADTSVVEVVDFNSNTTLSQVSFATPGFFNWQTASFQFTTGAATTTAAIAFTVKGNGNTSGVFDDLQVSIVPEPLTGALAAVGFAAVVVVSPRSRRL